MTTRGGRGSFQHIQLKMKNLQNAGRWGVFCCVISTGTKAFCVVFFSRTFTGVNVMIKMNRAMMYV